MGQDQENVVGKVLVIDDETAVSGVVQTVLSKEGYEVIVALNGADGLDSASQFKPDLILLDINMPEMNGYEVAQQLKQDPELMGIPIIFLTGKSAREDGGQAFASGAVSYVCKPFSGQQIRDLVTLMLSST